MKRLQHLVNEEALFSDSSVHTDFFSDSDSTSCSVDFNQKQVTSVAQTDIQVLNPLHAQQKSVQIKECKSFHLQTCPNIGIKNNERIIKHVTCVEKLFSLTVVRLMEL